MKSKPIVSSRMPALVALVTLAWAGGNAWTTPPGGPVTGGLAAAPFEATPIEPAVADRHALSTSLRVIEPGLQQPVDFSQVYRLPGAESQLLRAHGGLYAVFEESWYVRSPAGDTPVVPPGTRFYIGPPRDQSPPWAFDPTRLDPAAGTVVTGDRRPAPLQARVEAGVGREVPIDDPEPMAWLRHDPAWSPTGRRTARRPPAGSSRFGPTIANDAGYRAERLRELILAINARDGP